MIRKNLLLCKLIHVKTTSKSLFDSYMEKFKPSRETCPICKSTGSCHIHAYYKRSITDFISGKKQTDDLCILRVFCDSCGHAHAVLPDIIIPYSGYSLFFILFVLGEHFAGLHTIEQICERFDISRKQFYKWLDLWNSHKQQWLSVLNDSELDSSAFFKYLVFRDSYSDFSMEFIRRTAHSFLQSHQNSVLKRTGNSRCQQEIFSPDIFLF